MYSYRRGQKQDVDLVKHVTVIGATISFDLSWNVYVKGLVSKVMEVVVYDVVEMCWHRTTGMFLRAGQRLNRHAKQVF